MSESAEELPNATGDSDSTKKPVVQISPVQFYDKDFGPKNLDEDESDRFDFRPRVVDSADVDPKALYAPEPVSTSTSPTEPETESSVSLTPPASVEKVNTEPKEEKSGAQTSSSPTSTGKKEPTAPKE